jgi:hypothetical protein
MRSDSENYIEKLKGNQENISLWFNMIFSFTIFLFGANEGLALFLHKLCQVIRPSSAYACCA